jgi:catechol 2,3-dioxygenase-like lactoylglutathione lyase family enzyme
MEWKIEAIILPVADVDRSLEFYRDRLGFDLDVDHRAGENFRVVQFTPHGSACSVMFGLGLTDAAVGSVRGVHLVVADIVAAHAELAGRDVAVSPIRHMTPSGWQDGADPEHARYNSFADFADPDGNTWVLQEVPPQ